MNKFEVVGTAITIGAASVSYTDINQIAQALAALTAVAVGLSTIYFSYRRDKRQQEEDDEE